MSLNGFNIYECTMIRDFPLFLVLKKSGSGRSTQMYRFQTGALESAKVSCVENMGSSSPRMR